MVFPNNTHEKDADEVSLASKPKGVEWVLWERGLLNMISHGPWGPLAVCATCRMSQEAHDNATKAAKSCKEEFKTGIRALADCYECKAEAEDIPNFIVSLIQLK